MILPRRLLSLPIQKDATPYLAVDVLQRDGVVFFFADADVDCDGPNGNPDNDPYWQPETTLRYANGESVDSYKVPGIVVPPGICKAVKEMVIGCHAFATNLRTGQKAACVVYDIGPSHKLGELSVCLATRIDFNPSPIHGGDDSYDAVLYELIPGKAAVIDGVQFNLQPYGARN